MPVCCSRTVRRLAWYLITTVLCLWSVMMLKHVDMDGTSIMVLVGLSVSMPNFQQHTTSQCMDRPVMHLFAQLTEHLCSILPMLLLCVASCLTTQLAALCCMHTATFLSHTSNLVSVFCRGYNCRGKYVWQTVVRCGQLCACLHVGPV